MEQPVFSQRLTTIATVPHLLIYDAKILCDFFRNKDKKKTVLSQRNRAMPQLFFSVYLKFADNIHYKFKSSQASNARLQSSKHTCAKQNLTQNGHSWPFKVTCFGVSGKAIRD